MFILNMYIMPRARLVAWSGTNETSRVRRRRGNHEPHHYWPRNDHLRYRAETT